MYYDQKTGQWSYYSDNVQGYKEKYGNNGMHDRNRKLLKRLNKTGEGKERQQILHLLVENNLPLARSIAERHAKAKEWNREKTEDAYQDCSYILTRFVFSLNTDDTESTKPNYFQQRIYLHMTSYINSIEKRAIPENLMEMTRFDEHEHTNDDKTVPNSEFITWLVSNTCLTQRNASILLAWMYGNNAAHITPNNISDISRWYDLTENNIRMIIKKSFKKIRSFLNHYVFNNENHTIHREDFFIDLPD